MSDSRTNSPPPRWLLKLFTRLNVWIYRISNGRWLNEFNGDPICLVEMIGAKSRKKRTIPLMYVPDGEDVLLVASQGGAPTHPIWYYNLTTNPQVWITQDKKRRAMTAHELIGESRLAAWPVCVSYYAPYAEYETRTDRTIPVFRCIEI
ncbi:MAG: nitroreductase family deazaflavin-dependent oxidoreductase [Pseudomonadota bacterium]|nr:nitroreductase family deazaflavin-dependent oxidoreductase [Pseudomonadota bacterium]